MTFLETINAKILIAIIGSIVAFVSFIIPYIYTYKPLREHGFASPELKYRLWTRFMVFALLVHEWLLPVYIRARSDGIHGLDDQILSLLSVPIIIIFIISIAIAWFKHPKGIKGL